MIEKGRGQAVVPASPVAGRDFFVCFEDPDGYFIGVVEMDENAA